jgi:RNA polymerase sigma factor (sigma-70 family)
VTTRDQRFADLLAAHGPGLGRVVQSYARPADQDDLAQEISLALWAALPGFRGECSERTFVFRIAHNRGLTFLARRRVQGDALPEVADGAPGPEVRAAGRQDVDALFAALRTLPVTHRQVLALALEDVSHAEIAACLGITVENVAVRLSRARAALRKRLETEANPP